MSVGGGKSSATYRIVRYRQDDPSVTVMTGLSLAEAQEWCQRDDTHGDDWFDGYTLEDPSDEELARRATADERLLNAVEKLRSLGL